MISNRAGSFASHFLGRMAWSIYILGCLTLPLLIVRIASLTLSDMLFAVSLIIVVVLVASCRRLPNVVGIKAIFVAALAYTFSALVSSLKLGSEDLLDSVIATSKLFYLTIIWFSLGAFLSKSFDQGVTAVRAWTWGCAVSGAGAIAQSAISPTIIPGTESFFARAVGFTGHPNDLGASMAIGLIPAIALIALKNQSLAGKAVSFVVVFSISAGLVLSASASSIISASVSLFVWIALTGRFKLGLGLLVILLCFVLILGAFLESEAIDLSAISDIYKLSEGSKAGTLNERVETYTSAWAFVSNSPVFGIGTKPGGWPTENGYATHNILLGAWYETGIVGFVALCAIIFFCAIVSSRVFKLSRTKAERNIIAALIGAEVAFLIYSMSAPGLYQRYGWITVALMILFLNVKSFEDTLNKAEVKADSRQENCALPETLS